jgi:chloride channel 7
LFSVEDGASFWKKSLLWRAFFCSMVSTFVLNFFLSGYNNGWGTLSQAGIAVTKFWGPICGIGLVSFGNFDGDQPGYNLELFPFFLSLGVIGKWLILEFSEKFPKGGILGAIFNALNVKIYQLRQRWIHKKKTRIFEVSHFFNPSHQTRSS